MYWPNPYFGAHAACDYSVREILTGFAMIITVPAAVLLTTSVAIALMEKVILLLQIQFKNSKTPPKTTEYAAERKIKVFEQESKDLCFAMHTDAHPEKLVQRSNPTTSLRPRSEICKQRSTSCCPICRATSQCYSPRICPFVWSTAIS